MAYEKPAPDTLTPPNPRKEFVPTTNKLKSSKKPRKVVADELPTTKKNPFAVQ